MALTKTQKQKAIEELREKIERQKSIAILDIGGVKVKDLFELRKSMKKKDCELKVAKKTFVQLIFNEKKIKSNIRELPGEIALGFGYKDIIEPFKLAHSLSVKVEKLKILGGLMENKIISKEEAITLATLPSREELLTKLVGTIFNPISGFVNVLQGNIKGLIYALSAIKDIKINEQ